MIEYTNKITALYIRLSVGDEDRTQYRKSKGILRTVCKRA